MNVNIIKPPLRPCMVAISKGGKERKALFHCWEQWSDIVSPISETYGIVEFEDGTVKTVYPQLIRFLDNPFVEYMWEAGEQNDE